MQQKRQKLKRILMVISICIFFIMLILSTEVKAIANAGEAEQELTETNGKMKNYTIEDIIYNKIPILDVNIFSETLGGQKVSDNSITGEIRKIVSVWYITFRNIAIIALTIILIYSGIRMAISTIASDKAKYKELIFSWVKSLMILLLMHYLMIIILNANQIFVSLMEKTNQNLGKLYDTIKARAYDVRFSVGIPGTIMYAILVIFFIRFLIVYFKRYFTVMILIVIAPFVTIKYAIESLKKKGGQSFNKWVYDFSINVFMQSVHALIYTALVSISADLAVQSVWGFIIALVLMKSMFKSSKLFTQVFKFNGGSEIGRGATEFEDSGKIFKPFTLAKEAAIPFKVAGGVTKRIVGVPIGVGKTIMNKTNVGKKVKGKIVEEKNIVMNAFDKNVGQKIADKLSIKKPELANKIIKISNLRINARKKGTKGEAAKKTLNKFRKMYTKSFTSNVKFIKDVTVGTAEMIIAVPVMFAYDNTSVGMALFETGKNSISKYKLSKRNRNRKFKGKDLIFQVATAGTYGTMRKFTDNRAENHKKSKKEYKKIDKVIDYVNEENILMDKVDEKFKEFDDEDEMKKAKEEALKVSSLNINSYIVKVKIESYIKEHETDTIDFDAMNGIMETIVNDSNIEKKYGEEKKNEVMRISQGILNDLKKQNIKEKNLRNNFISEQISDKIVSEVISDNKYKQIAIGINEMKNISDKCQNETGNKILNENKYINEQVPSNRYK